MVKRQSQSKSDSNSNEFDVVIVGAGAVGSALAIQLGDLGYHVAIVDAYKPNYASSDPERVIALSHGSKCYLEELGVSLGESVAGQIRHIHVSEPGNDGHVEMDVSEAELLLNGSKKNSKHTMDALGYVVEMGDVLKPLHEKMQGAVTFLAPVSIERIDFGHGERKTELYISDQGESRCLKTSLLVGADGTQSQVRLKAGIGTKGWDYNRFGLVLSANLEQEHQNIAYECFRESGPLAFLPMSDGRYSIIWALAPTEAMRLLQMPDMTFIKKLERMAGKDVVDRFGPIKAIGKRFCFPLELRVAQQYAKAGVALVGNAAHTIHPVAGQGMNLGFRDAAVLAEVLSSDLSHNNPGASILMQAYAEKRRADVLAVAGFTDSLVHTFGISNRPAKLVRGRALDSLQLMPSLRSMLLGQASGVAQMNKMKLPEQLMNRGGV
ncbi:MAG: FAD-dependent monooxygenase [Mariprofundaceae bacterium]